MQLNPYLHFNGQCEEAFTFYRSCLGGKIEALLRHQDAPCDTHVPEDWKGKVMHARLVFGDQAIMGCDAPSQCYKTPQGFSASLETKDAAEAEQIFSQLAQDGTVEMPIQETFWAIRFGMVIDRFGIPWMVNCSKAA
ncbi:MAG: VOC family protein [Acidobacteria bacterium]|nr:VOC family protein [Acidobacteriota bacterium]